MTGNCRCPSLRAPALAAGLLERSRELARLGEAIARARAGAGSLTLIEGAAGAGKSRLLGWATAHARDQDLQVLQARSGEPERDFSFGVVLQLLERPLRAATAGERAHLLGGAAGLARQLLDGEHSGEEPPGSPAPPGLVHGLFWVVANLAERAPVVLAIDDLHWSDEPSVRFLLYLMRQLEELPVAVLLTRRSGEGGHLVGELAGDPLTHRIRPVALSEHAVTRLLSEQLHHEVGARFAASARHATGGNPFLVAALIQSLADEQIAPADENAARIAQLRPAAVRQQVLVRISRLGEQAAALASAAAVVGDGGALTHAATLAGLDPDATATAADALIGADILSSASPLQFTHPLVWAAVHAETAAAQRGRWHARAARLLYDEHAAPEAVCAQLLSAARTDERWAAELLHAGARRALQAGNPHSAIRYLTRALHEPMPRGARAQILVDLARAKATVGEPSAEQDLDQALPLIVDARERARAHQTLGSVLYIGGDPARAAHEFERGLALVDDPGDELARELRAGYYSAASLLPDRVEQARAAIEPLLGRRAGDESRAERGALAGTAVYLAISGAPREQAIRLARRAWGEGQLLLEEGPDGWSWSLITGAFCWTGELAAALEVADAVIEQARRRGSLMAYATASFASVAPAHMAGRLSDAQAHAQAAVDARRRGWRTYPGALLASLGGLLIDLDQLDEAERELQLLDDAAYGTPAGRAWATTTRGRLRLVQGRPREALDDLLAGAEVFAQIAGPHDSLVMWRPVAALAAAQLGDRHRAMDLLAQASVIANRTGMPTHESEVLRAQAQLEPASAVERLSEALGILEPSQYLTERLRVQAELGAALRRSGQRARAREVLRPALDQAHAIGARRIERQVREELRVAGARPRRPALSGTQALTASERRIVELARDGADNRTIAQALFITRRTVEQHLYNAYKKLGIGSRSELSAALGPIEPTDRGHGRYGGA